MTLEVGAGEVLSRDQRDAFARDGFLVIDEPCPRELIDAVAADMQDVLNDDFDAGPEINRDGVIYTRHAHRQDSEFHWHRVMQAWRITQSIRDLALAPRVLSITEELFGRRVLPFQTLNFPVGTEQPPHIDGFFFNSDPQGYMCGVWVALEDVDMDNGPLIYYPGSHKLPLPKWSEIEEATGTRLGRSDFDSEDDWKQARNMTFTKFARELVDKHGFEAQYGTIRKGQALLWAPNLLHGGAPQRDRSRTRLSQVTHYFFEGCRHFSPLRTDGDHVPWDYPVWIREPPPDRSPASLSEFVAAHVPAGSTMLVVSPGYEFLFELDDRKSWPFPEGEDGHQVQLDALGAGAIDQLEELRKAGAEYLVVPRDQLWWLEYRATELQQHVENTYPAVARDGAHAAIFDLTAGVAAGSA